MFSLSFTNLLQYLRIKSSNLNITDEDLDKKIFYSLKSDPIVRLPFSYFSLYLWLSDIWLLHNCKSNMNSLRYQTQWNMVLLFLKFILISVWHSSAQNQHWLIVFFHYIRCIETNLLVPWLSLQMRNRAILVHILQIIRKGYPLIF